MQIAQSICYLDVTEFLDNFLCIDGPRQIKSMYDEFCVLMEAAGEAVDAKAGQAARSHVCCGYQYAVHKMHADYKTSCAAKNITTDGKYFKSLFEAVNGESNELTCGDDFGSLEVCERDAPKVMQFMRSVVDTNRRNPIERQTGIVVASIQLLKKLETETAPN